MSKKAHTPGPWHVPSGSFTGLSVEAGEPIACPGYGGSMSDTQIICGLSWLGTEEWEANARLIAAAPDMLEALEEIAGLETPNANATVRRMASIARAAIAKTTEN